MVEHMLCRCAIIICRHDMQCTLIGPRGRGWHAIVNRACARGKVCPSVVVGKKTEKKKKITH